VRQEKLAFRKKSIYIPFSYLVGVHNKRTGTTTLRAAPLHLLIHRVKALKGLKSPPVSVQEYAKARATLGTTFGTKKAKANIRAQERNMVDVSAMEGVVEHLQDRIEQNTVTLPTQGKLHVCEDQVLTDHHAFLCRR
jgi:DNA-directed RNA polymerase I subunit RPA49